MTSVKNELLVDVRSDSKSQTLRMARQKRHLLHCRRLIGSSEGIELAKAVQKVLGLPLEGLHKYVGPYPIFSPGNDNTTATHQQLYRNHAAVEPLFRKLAERIVKEMIGEPCHLQAIPSYRFGLPGNRWVGSYHKDSDSGHGDFELNAICAFTPMLASAALHVEQSIGAQDFAPMELETGEVILFDHIDRVHGCPINQEGVSVASIDFRFVPQRFAKPAFNNQALSVNTGTPFLPGGYFTHEIIG